MPVHPEAQALLDALRDAGLPPFECMTVPQAREATAAFLDLQRAGRGHRRWSTAPSRARTATSRCASTPRRRLRRASGDRLLPRRRLGHRGRSRPSTGRAARSRTRPASSWCRSTTGSRPSTATRRRSTTATRRPCGWPSTPTSSAPTAAARGRRRLRRRQPRGGGGLAAAGPTAARRSRPAAVLPGHRLRLGQPVLSTTTARATCSHAPPCSGSGRTTWRADPADDPVRRPRCARRPVRAAAGVRRHRRVRPAARRGRGLRARLRAAGVSVTAARYDGMIHGFLWTLGATPSGTVALDDLTESLWASSTTVADGPSGRAVAGPPARRPRRPTAARPAGSGRGTRRAPRPGGCALVVEGRAGGAGAGSDRRHRVGRRVGGQRDRARRRLDVAAAGRAVQDGRAGESSGHHRSPVLGAGPTATARLPPVGRCGSDSIPGHRFSSKVMTAAAVGRSPPPLSAATGGDLAGGRVDPVVQLKVDAEPARSDSPPIHCRGSTPTSGGTSTRDGLRARRSPSRGAGGWCTWPITAAPDLDSERPVHRRHPLGLYSMTKPITSVAALMLYERGALELTDPVVALHPGVRPGPGLPGGLGAGPGHRAGRRAGRRIPHLLTHTAGMLPTGSHTPARWTRCTGPKGFEFAAPPGMGSRRGLRRVGRAAAALPPRARSGTTGVHRRAGPGGRRSCPGGRWTSSSPSTCSSPLGTTDPAFSVPAEDLGRLATLDMPNPPRGLAPSTRRPR